MITFEGKEAKEALDDFNRQLLFNIEFYSIDDGFGVRFAAEEDFTMLVNTCDNREEIKDKISLACQHLTNEFAPIVAEVIEQLHERFKNDIESMKNADA